MFNVFPYSNHIHMWFTLSFFTSCLEFFNFKKQNKQKKNRENTEKKKTQTKQEEKSTTKKKKRLKLREKEEN